MKIQLKQYQQEISDFIYRHRRCAVYAGMGTGKTGATLHAISRFTKDFFPVLILAPTRVVSTVWPVEAKKWDFPYAVCPLTGDPQSRIDKLEVGYPVYAISYDLIPWLIDALPSFPFQTLVLDESTKLKNYRSGKNGVRRGKALAKVSNVGRIIELTGTPAPNGLIDLWGQLWFLDGGYRLGKTFNTFTDRYYMPCGYGGYEHKLKPGAEEFIKDRIRDICITIDIKDYCSIDEPITHNVYVDLPPKAAKIYKSLEDKLFADLSREIKVTAFNAGSRTMKCLQVANGSIYLEDLPDDIGDFKIESTPTRNYSAVHNEKLDALESIIEEANGMPILVVYTFQSDMMRIKDRFKGQVLKGIDTIDAWNKGEISLLLLHPASAGHGLNLQYGGNIIVFFSHWWNLDEKMQVIERIGPMRQKQAGFDRPVFVYNLIARGTVDEVVLASLGKKEKVQSLLLQHLKRKYSELEA